MPAIINFLQQTGFYMFGQDGNGKCLIMIAISFILMYLAIVKGFEPLLLLPISFGMLCTNLPGADMFHEILFAGGHVHWDLFGGTPVTASFIAEMSESGVSDEISLRKNKKKRKKQERKQLQRKKSICLRKNQNIQMIQPYYMDEIVMAS